MRDPKKYCIYAFNYPFIDNDGYVALCCKNTTHKLPYHISEYSLDYIWNSPEMLAVRQQFLEGAEPKGCFKCYDPERRGIRSFRTKTLGSIAGKYGSVPYEDEKIRALDLRLGNICNLRCTMCFAGNSNRIYQRLPEMAEHFKWSKGKLDNELEKYHASKFGWANDERAWDNIMSAVTPDLQEVYIAGGEPFYLTKFPETVERLASIAKDARFEINSNGTRLLRDKDIERFSDNKIHIRLSVDGWGKADEFTRQETVWEEKLEVMDQYYKVFNLDVWDVTANVFSFRHVKPLVDYVYDRYPDTVVQIRPVVNKPELALNNIPMQFREETLDYFKKFRTQITWESKLQGVEHVISELEKPYVENSEMKQKMRTLVEYYEKTGNVMLSEFDLELSNWLFK